MVKWLLDFIGIFIAGALVQWGVKKLPRSLLDNAVTGYIDSKIGWLIGLSEPQVDGFLLEWAIPVLMGLTAVIIWHRTAAHQLRKAGHDVTPRPGIGWAKKLPGLIRIWITRVEPTHVIVLGLVIALGGVTWQILRPSVRPVVPLVGKVQETSGPIVAGARQVTNASSAEHNSVLIVNKVYPRKNKEDLFEIIDGVDSTIKMSILPAIESAKRVAQINTWEDNNEGIAALLHSLTYIEAGTVGLQSGFFDARNQNHVAYENELRKLAGSNDAIIKFQNRTVEFGSALKILSSLSDATLRESVKTLVRSSLSNYMEAVRDLTVWVEQVKDRIWDTRKELQK